MQQYELLGCKSRLGKSQCELHDSLYRWLQNWSTFRSEKGLQHYQQDGCLRSEPIAIWLQSFIAKMKCEARALFAAKQPALPREERVMGSVA